MASGDPPVTRRPPEFSIDKDGVWHYRGSSIQREALVRMLASMLQRQGEGYVLVTPEQNIRVQVDDAPFVVTDLECIDTDGAQGVCLITSVGDRVRLDADHPLVMRAGPDGVVRAYLVVAPGMQALVHRSVFYTLADRTTTREADGRMGIHSFGCFFPLE
jgi:hypothetical protein